MNKETLRNLFLEKRRTLNQSEFNYRNNQIVARAIHLLSSFGVDNKTVHIFSSIEKQFEVNTWPLIDWLHGQNTHVVLPKIKAKRKLTHHLYNAGDELLTNKWGIAEPTSVFSIDPETLDFVFVPMICFDKSGNRIGYGGGFYDAFLSQTRTDCSKIGLCLTPPLDQITYNLPHDVPLDYCITHLKTYKY